MFRMGGCVEYEDEGATDQLPTKRSSAVLACNGLQWPGNLKSRDTNLDARAWDGKKKISDKAQGTCEVGRPGRR